MAKCNALLQYSQGQQCQGDAMPGKTKCRAHGSGGVRTEAGRAAIAAAHSKGLNDSREARLAHQARAREMFVLAQLAGIGYIGRIPNGGIEDLEGILNRIAKRK